MAGDKQTKDLRLMVCRRKVLNFVVRAFVILGLTVVYYIVFSLFFDTPVEYRMKTSTADLRKQYNLLNARYDSLATVLENVKQRDRNVCRILFEADPYDYDDDGSSSWMSHERLLEKTNRDLGREFSEKLGNLGHNVSYLNYSYRSLQQKIADNSTDARYIPAIQPVVNRDLTLLTASFGLRIHPFYRTLTPHSGVDYTVPEGTRVFATADGTVKEISSKNTGSGLTVVLSHGNGYETSYSHLSKVTVQKGAKVRRGDIVALTGDTGLSLAPHLHYEIKHNGMRIDPIHYFFMELSPADYQRIMRIAQSGMQSFD